MTGATAGERRAWGWVAGLRAGSTTPWRQWREETEHAGRALPGAQQLELVRRLNLAGRPDPRLVQRVLTASAPGRGNPDLELVGAAQESPFGPRPVDPSDLPEGELVRVAAGLLAEDLVADGTPPPLRAARPRPWGPAYRLVGDPWLTDPARAELRRRGRPPGRRRPVVFVLGTDLASMLAHAWTARAFDEGGAPWPDWVARAAERPRPPRRVDLVGQARLWAGRVGPDRVQVVLDPARLPRLVGVRRRLPAPPPLSADAVELARRVGAPLALLVLPRRRAELLRETLAPRLLEAPGAPLGVPAELDEGVRRQAARMREALLAAGYAVHGDPDLLLPSTTGRGADPAEAGVLALAVRLLLDGPTGPGSEGGG